MAGITERLNFVLSLDADSAVRGFENVAKTADKELGRTEDRIDKVGATMTKAGATMLAVGGIAAAGLVSAAGAASDLNEAVNVTNITFGDAADEIDAFAKTAATSLGQSERAAREATASFGGLLQNLGFTNDEAADTSIQLTRLASDLSSAFNREPAEAVAALGSALRGEAEPIRAFNVLLSDQAIRQKAVEMGLAATTAAVDANGKAQATLALITEQTARYQGDFANTADGAANAQRILTAQWEDFRAQLGQGVLPVMEDVLGAANGLLGGVMSLNDATGGLITTTATWGTGILLAGGAVTTVGGQVLKFRDTLNKLPGPLSASTVGAAALGVAVVGIAWQWVTARAAEQERRISELAAAYRAAREAGEGYSDMIEDQVYNSDALQQLMRLTGVSIAEIEDALTGSEDTWDTFKQNLIDTGVEAMKMGNESELAIARYRLQVDGLIDELDANREAFVRDAEAADLLDDNIGELANGSIRAREHMINLRTDAVTPLESETKTLAETFERLLGSFDAADAYDSAVDSLDEVKRAAFEAYIAQQTGAVNAGAKQRELEGDIRASVEEIIRYADEIGNVPPEMITEIIADLNAGNYAEVERKLAELERRRTVTYSVVDQPTRNPDRRAVGGPVAAGSPYLVGERGPELFVPGASGMIVPNHRLGGAGGGALGATYNITVNALDPQAAGRAVVDAIRSYERSNGKGWRVAA